MVKANAIDILANAEPCLQRSLDETIGQRAVAEKHGFRQVVCFDPLTGNAIAFIQVGRTIIPEKGILIER